MKNWFNNLDNKYKVLIHIVLCLAFFIVPSCIGDNANAFVYLIWLAIPVFEIIFIVWHIQYKKSQQNNVVKADNNSNQIDNIVKQEPITPKKVIESSLDLDEVIENDDGLTLKVKYAYKEQLCFCENFDKFKLVDEVSFEHDPNNEYDKNTIIVKVNDEKIGLMYNGNCRDILLKCLKNNKYEVRAFVCKKDDDKKKISIRIGFYEPLNEEDTLVATLIKTGKKDILTDEKRQEQVEYLSQDERVYLEEDFNCDGLLVKSDTGYELGELSQSVSEKILDRTHNVENLYVKVLETDLDDNLKTKVKLKTYF